MFSQSHLKVSASHTDVGNLAVQSEHFDFVNYFLSVVGFLPVNIGQTQYVL